MDAIEFQESYLLSFSHHTGPFMNNQQNLIEKLGALLTDPLPGPEAQLHMAPQGRRLPDDPLDHLAAVLIAFIVHEGEWHFPLIHRVEDGYEHSGQIGLPGGRKDGSESPEETALREAFEEIHLTPDRVTLLGRLSPLPIPISRTRVLPIIGKVEGSPCLSPDPKEVQSIFLVNIQELLDENNIRRETWTLRNSEFEVPYFLLHGFKVWGATAMILNELRSLLLKITIPDL